MQLRGVWLGWRCYSSKGCDWDGGDCVEFTHSLRRILIAMLIHSRYSTAECGRDGGDCRVELNKLDNSGGLSCAIELRSMVGSCKY